MAEYNIDKITYGDNIYKLVDNTSAFAAVSPLNITTTISNSINTKTLSLNNNYGDSKNPYAAKEHNLILAGPSTGNAAAPSFRALVPADIPILTMSKISDFDSTKLKNGSTKSALSSAAITATTNRQYAVELDTNGYLSVNVPWEAGSGSGTGTDEKVKQINSTEAYDYRVLLSNLANDLEQTGNVLKSNKLIFNPNTGRLTTDTLIANKAIVFPQVTNALESARNLVVARWGSATSGTQTTLTAPAGGVYLLLGGKYNNTTTGYSGAWILSLHSSNSSAYPLREPSSSPPTVNVSGLNITLTINTANYYFTLIGVTNHTTIY